LKIGQDLTKLQRV